MRRANPKLDARAAETAWREVSERQVAQDATAACEPFNCQTVTPLYGGGVRAGEVDSELPIRPSGLRGQLRFWWRLLNRSRYPSSRELFAAEKVLWGGIGADGPTASRVRVRVGDVSRAERFPAFEFKPKPDGTYGTAPKAAPGVSAYALFSAQGKLTASKREIEERPRLLAKAGVKFALHIDCPPERWAEVELALRWWASFGGVGARTRRGLGAVQVNGLVNSGSTPNGLLPVMAKDVAEAGGRLVLGRQQHDATAAWNTAVDALRDFRQKAGVGRNPGNEHNRPGRSRWPEADMIRRLSGQHANMHVPEHPAQDCFPRAAFGLPVVFHFKDGEDPPDHILEPDGDFDRMASPLILRPYWDGQVFRPAALLLPGWQRALQQHLKFKDTQHRHLETWPSDPAMRQETAKTITPMAEHGVDPLTAFLDFFAKGGE